MSSAVKQRELKWRRIQVLELSSKGYNQREPQNPELSESAAGNLASIEEEIETSSQYFKPIPGKVYMIKMDPQNDKILPVQNDRFKDPRG